MQAVRTAPPEELTELAASLHDARLKTLLPLYKARNYPSSLTSEERAQWDSFCAEKLFSGEQASRLAEYFARLGELSKDNPATGDKAFLLQELQLYGESIMPGDVTA